MLSEKEEKARNGHAEYMRQWRAKNPGKNAEACRRYRQRKREKEAERAGEKIGKMQDSQE